MEIFIGILIILIILVISIIFKEKENIKNIETFKNNKEIVRVKLEKYGFSSSLSIPYNENSMGAALMVDHENKKIALCHYSNAFIEYISFNQIINVEILKNNATIMKGGIGRAVIGGVLAGGVGAVVGASTRDSEELLYSLKIRVITNDINKPLYVIKLNYNEIAVGSQEYNTIVDTANKIYSLIFSIANKDNKQNSSTGENNPLEQIEKLATLKEKKFITDEEFKTKKKELLNKI